MEFGRSYAGLKRFLLIFSSLIFDSRVDLAIPSLAAAPDGPYTRPPLSRRADSIMAFSCAGSLFSTSGRLLCSLATGRRDSQLSSTANVPVSQTITDRSITFCSSRILPGHEYDWSKSRL